MIASNQLKQRAKSAYELARLKEASRWLLIILPLVCLGLYSSHSSNIAILCGFSLAILVVGAKWRGQQFGFGVLPGLLAGATAFVIPFMLHFFEICCRYDIETAACAVSGAIGGFILGRMVGRSRRERRFASLTVGLAIAVTTALMGCLSFEVGALVGLLGALLIAGLSAYQLQGRLAR